MSKSITKSRYIWSNTSDPSLNDSCHNQQSLVLFVEIFPGDHGTPAAGNKRSIIFTWLGQFWGQEFVLRRYEPSLILTHFTPLKIPPTLKSLRFCFNSQC